MSLERCGRASHLSGGEGFLGVGEIFFFGTHFLLYMYMYMYMYMYIYIYMFLNVYYSFL